MGMGSLRYGGPSGLYMRVRAEIIAQLPHQRYMPTPLPTTAQAPVDTPTWTPTAHPTPTPLPTASPSVSQTATPTSFPGKTNTIRPSTAHTPLPSMTRTAAPTTMATPTARPTRTPARRTPAPFVALEGFTHMWQTWNNCGPATLAMDLSYFGLKLGQAEVGAAIRPNKEDKHAGADELAAYARVKGLRAAVRVNGDEELLKLLLSEGVPVIIATWHENEKKEGMGHYRLVTGYDEKRREWILYDSLESRGVNAKEPYRGIRMPYDELDRLWAVFNRLYVVVYKSDMAPAVLGIIGQETESEATRQAALARAEEEIKQRPDDAFAWFTLGTNLVALGRWDAAAAAYDRARIIGLPFRMLWYQFGPLQAYYETKRYNELLALADATLAVTTDIEELHYWKGLGLEAIGDIEGARKELQRAVSQRPSYPEALAALARIGK